VLDTGKSAIAIGDFILKDLLCRAWAIQRKMEPRQLKKHPFIFFFLCNDCFIGL